MKPPDIDLIVVATSTPDFVFPSTACLLQAKLGVKGCAAFDVQAVCSGFVYALATADSFIKTGSARRRLVVGAEVFSRILDWNDRGTCVLFGDGAGAVVLVASDKPGIHASVLHADGSQARMLSVPGNVCGGTRHRLAVPADERAGGVQVRGARCWTSRRARRVAAAGMQLADIDWLIPHQANVRILDATARKLGLPREKLVVTVDHHGNTSAASVPLALDEFVRAGQDPARPPRAAAGRGRRLHLGLDACVDAMKLAMVFPGQGSQSVGMMKGFAGLPASTRPSREADELRWAWIS